MGAYKIEEVGVPIVFGKCVPTHFSFRITDPTGKQIKYFDKHRDKTTYLAIISKDLSYFRHYLYNYDKKLGVFTIPDLYFPEDGEYRLVADFFPLNIREEEIPHAHSFFDITIVGKGELKPFDSPAQVRHEGIYKISMWSHPEALKKGPAELIFEIRIDNRPLTQIEEYLGGFGQLSLFRRNTLEFTHEIADKERDPSRESVAGQIGFKVIL